MRQAAESKDVYLSFSLSFSDFTKGIIILQVGDTGRLDSVLRIEKCFTACFNFAA
jgi:hypothetical protein